MIQGRYSRVLIWSVVILAVMNVVTIGTIAFHVWKSPSVNVRSVMNTSSAQQTFNGRFIVEQLDLDSNQFTLFKQVNLKFRSKARTINAKLIAQRERLLDEMDVENPDLELLNMYSDSIGNLHSSLKKHTYIYYLDLKGICTNDQQPKLKTLFGDFFNVNEQPGNDQQRRYRGGRNNKH